MAALALYIVVNPSGVSSVFLGLTKGATTAERRSIAFRAAIGGGHDPRDVRVRSAPTCSGCFASPASALQIAGGIFVFGVAFALARGKEDEFFGAAAHRTRTATTSRSIAWAPLAVPLIAGTGLDHGRDDAVRRRALRRPSPKPACWPPSSTVALLCLLSMLRFLKLSERRGSGFDFVLPRIMGLLLAVIAVQFVIEGIEQVLPRFAEAIRAAASTSGD